MEKKIVSKDTTVRKMICKKLGLSTGGLSLALSFQRNSPKAHQAREMALENGGFLMEEKPMSRVTRILNAKGETERTITNK